jgi:hypothetical protein
MLRGKLTLEAAAPRSQSKTSLPAKKDLSFPLTAQARWLVRDLQSR